MNKIIILGCGYIGTNIAQYINLKYHNENDIFVVGLKNEYVNFLDKNIKFISLNINDIKEDEKKLFENSIVIDCIRKC